MSVAGCAGPTPTIDATRVLHLENRVSQALLVSVNARGGGSDFSTAIRPCGGRLDLTVGREIPIGDDWLIFLSYDRTGIFDQELSQWRGDPSAMPGNVTVSIVWSRGDIRTVDLPKWVTMTPEAVRFDTAPPADPLIPPCGDLPSPGSAPPSG
jgi:hypothetical protein